MFFYKKRCLDSTHCSRKFGEKLSESGEYSPGARNWTLRSRILKSRRKHRSDQRAEWVRARNLALFTMVCTARIGSSWNGVIAQQPASGIRPNSSFQRLPRSSMRKTESMVWGASDASATRSRSQASLKYSDGNIDRGKAIDSD